MAQRSYGGKPGVNDTRAVAHRLLDSAPWPLRMCDPDLMPKPPRPRRLLPLHRHRTRSGTCSCTGPGADRAEDHAGSQGMFDFDKSVAQA